MMRKLIDISVLTISAVAITYAGYASAKTDKIKPKNIENTASTAVMRYSSSN